MFISCAFWLNLLRPAAHCVAHLPGMEWAPLPSSDIVQIGATAVLALVAFIAPYSVWLWRRKYLSPRLHASFELKEPMARLSSRSKDGRPTGIDVYDFHFVLVNRGRSPALNTVAEVVEFWYENQEGRFVRHDQFLPVYLRYYDTESVDIHPHRPYYWNIGEIPSPKHQKKWRKGAVYDAPGKRGRGHRLFLDLHKPPHYQVNALLRGTYGLVTTLYSENADPVTIRLRIEWTGNWRATTAEMLNEVRIAQVGSFS